MKVGVIGSGSFGITVSSLIAHNCDVMIYSRNPKTRSAINDDHFHKNTKLNKRIVAVDDMAKICEECQFKKALASNKFFVFGSHDITGAELAGAFKNIIAIASGILGGLQMGKNLQALLITRGLREMVQFGISMGANANSFLGSAGIGDLIATATSTNSRNYTFGTRLAGGETLQDILDTSDEIIEGLRTLMIVHRLADSENIKLPITEDFI